MGNYHGDIAEDATIDIGFNTAASGVPTTLAGGPVISVYKGNSDTQSVVGVTLEEDADSLTGFNRVRIDTSNVFYATGNDYKVVITTGTVSGLSVAGSIVGEFSIENRTSLLNDAEDVYHADVHFTVDTGNTQDEYTITWFKNGVRITAGITVPTLSVLKRADGTELLNAGPVTPTQIGASGSWKYDETTDANRMTAGESGVAVVTATIDGSSRNFARVISRDA